MADINLNIGSDDLDKLKKLLAEIQKAADKLKKTIESAGNVTDDDVLKAKKLAAEHKKVENAIKKEEMAASRMAAQQERVNQKTREAKGIIGGLEAEARKFRSAMKSANNEAEMKAAQAGLKKTQAALTKAKGTTASWGKALGSFQFKFNALGNIAANVLSKMTSQMSQLIKDSARMAAAAEGIDRAFRKLNDPNLLNNLRDATRGTVSDVSLMTAAVKANNFKIPLEQLPKYFEFASQRAIETGESVDYLVESIVNGVARKSLPILDNLGLSATELRSEMSKTGDMAEAVANIIERDMGGANRPLATTAELYAQATANADNLKVQFGQIVNLFGAKLLPHAQGFVNLLKEALQTQEMIQRQVLDASIIWQLEQDRVEVLDVANRLKAKGVELSEGQTYEQRSAILLLERYNSLLANTDESNVKMIEQLSAQIKALEVMGGVAKDNSTVIEEEVYTLEEINEIEAKRVRAANSQLKAIEDQEAALVRMAELLKTLADIDAGGPASRIAEAVKGIGEGIDLGDDFWDGWLDGFDVGVTDETQAMIDRFKEAFNEVNDAADDTFDRVVSTISKAMSTASDITGQFSDIFAAQKAKELSAVGDNAEKRLAIEKEYAKKEQNLAIINAIINTAQGIVKVLSDYGLPWGLIPAAAMAALGGAQIATIKSQQFAEGGDVIGPSHAGGGVNIEAEGGEYVINKKSTGKYKDLIEAINQDDQVRIMDAMSRDKKIVASGFDPYTRKMYELMKTQVQYGQDNEYWYKHKGNQIVRSKKK